MRIALLVASFNIRAKEALNITTKSLAQTLKAAGNDVSIITKRREDEARNEDYKGVKVYRFFRNPLFPRSKYNYFGVFVWVLRNIMIFPFSAYKTKKRFHILHSMSSAPILILRSLLSKIFNPRAKVVHTIKGHSFFGYRFVRILNFADKVLVPTKLIKTQLIKKGCSKNKIVVIRSPIDTSVFVPRSKKLLKRKYNYVGKRIVLYYGHTTELKGVNHFLDAAKLVKDSHVIFLIVPSAYNEFVVPYVNRIQEERITNVLLIDSEVNIVDYVNLADVVVLPYPSLLSTEGNPSCLIETMACQTPIITTNLPELREILTHGVDALLAKPKDPVDLAEKISALLDDKVLQKNLIKLSRDKSQEFDITKIAEQHLTIYSDLVRADPPRKAHC